jgi:hypothetical protein
MSNENWLDPQIKSPNQGTLVQIPNTHIVSNLVLSEKWFRAPLVDNLKRCEHKNWKCLGEKKPWIEESLRFLYCKKGVFQSSYDLRTNPQQIQ